MGRVLLVRHGQASFGAADYDVLSDLGHEQSAALGRALAVRGVRPDVVVRGDLARHQHTLDGLLDAAGWSAEVGEVAVDPGWNEYDHVEVLSALDADPAWTPSPDISVAELFDRALGRWAEGQDDGDYAEPFSAFATRVRTAASDLVAGLGSKATALVISSGGPISWVVTELIAAGHPTWRRLNTTAVNTGIATVTVGRRGPHVISINEHTHLPPELITYR
jgi:broad specificity phosphatase PhoE